MHRWRLGLLAILVAAFLAGCGGQRAIESGGVTIYLQGRALTGGGNRCHD